jgi:hypothetical protein
MDARRFGMENTLRVLDGDSEMQQAIGRELFVRYMRYLDQEGLFGDLSMLLPGYQPSEGK